MARILQAGRDQLAEHGAAALSLRAVAREVGLVSSAVYRYVASRDELLTALIVEAYDAIGAAVEEAASGRVTPGRRFLRAAHAIRTWGIENPHEYALLYGSPVPGYRAPQATVEPAARVPLALAGLVAEAYAAGTLRLTDAIPKRPLAAQAARTAETLGVDLDDRAVLALLQGWTAIHGFVGFELTGQLVGSFEPAEQAAAYTFESIARQAGFTDC